MTAPGFAHLHVHTHYSLLDGATEIKQLVHKVKNLGMPAVAVTDHGNLFGAIEFFSSATAAGVKPIIGMEAYLAPGRRQDRDARCIGGDYSYHLLLLARNLTGYRNLLKLASIGYLEGFYYKPRIDKDTLAEFSDGLICTSTCLGAELPQILLHRDRQLAETAAEAYLKIFGSDHFFIEVQDHGIEEQRQINPALFDMAQRLGVGTIVTNDVHYLDDTDVEAHDVLCCISTGSLVSDDKRFKFPSDQFYLKSAEEMATLFPEHPEVLANTLRIVEMCDLELDFSTRHAPVYTVPDARSDAAYLRDRVYQGAARKYEAITDELRERIEYELEVISSKGFSSYFLICWDLMNHARGLGIPCCARGSGCSSVVGYCLDISTPEPLRYGLYFERFMDPDRDEMPDIDIDICQDGRQKVIDYVRSRYGHVAQIITFGTLKARAAVKDVCRVLGIDFERATRLSRLIPAELHMTLAKALSIEPELQRLCREDPQVAKVIEIAKRIEGLARHAGVHAAGVVIADQPLNHFLPLYKPPGGNGSGAHQQIVTQYDGPTVEKVGLLKMDFLGLRTLTTLERARRLAEQAGHPPIDLEHLDLNDQQVYALFAEGNTKGIFQFESDGMRDVVRKMRPNRIEDLIAANALFRPGPMVNIEAYVARKHGEAWDTPHPLMTEILRETFGIMVYQEQVSRLVHRLGNIELKKAFRLAKAISKKKTSMIEAMRGPFLDGCAANGVPRPTAEQIFEDILRFGGYAFNKAHSAGYALIAFQTAYLKTYYPVEFMAALLTFEMSSTDKVVEYIEACRAMGISVRPPDVNVSNYDFTPVYNPLAPPTPPARGQVRFGLGAIKGVGEKAVQATIAARDEQGPFTSIFEFCERVDLATVNRSAIEALIKCGAFDCTGAMRKAMMVVLDQAFEGGQRSQRDRLSGQMSLLEMLGADDDIPEVTYPTIPDDEQWTEAELLKFEKDTLGFYITNHPLAQYADLIQRFGTATSDRIGQLPADTEIIMGGIITKVRTVLTKRGRKAGSRMSIVTLEDIRGSVEAIVFPSDLDRFRPDLVLDNAVFIKGTVDRRREDPALRVVEVIPLDQAAEKLTAQVVISLTSGCHQPDIMQRLHSVIKAYSGDKPVVLRITTSDNLLAAVRCDRGLSVSASQPFCDAVTGLLGRDSLELYGAAHYN